MVNNPDIADLQIFIITYNHEKFIKKTIDSIINQKTDYKFKVIVHDDHSTDNTSDILNKYKNKYEEIITINRNSTNIGPLETAKLVSQQFMAKYITWLDGDDYWCNDKKIQTQLDFLENNPDYAGCFHDSKILQSNNNEDIHFLKRTQNQWKTYSQFNRYTNDFMPWELIKRNIVPTASLIFRRHNIKEFLNTYTGTPLSLSWALHLEIIKNSKFKYFNETWSVYNDHPHGLSKTYDLIEFKKSNIKILKALLLDNTWNYYQAEIYKAICEEFRFLLKTKETQESPKAQYKKTLKQYEKFLKQATITDLQQLKDDYYYVRNNGMVE